MGLWTYDEAWEFLNTRYHLKEMKDDVVEEMVRNLMAMKHRPWCRTHMADLMPNYGSECTCDGSD